MGADEGAMRGDGGLDNSALVGNKLLAHGLVGWAANLGLRLEVFSLGPAAALIGADLVNLVLCGCYRSYGFEMSHHFWNDPGDFMGGYKLVLIQKTSWAVLSWSS